MPVKGLKRSDITVRIDDKIETSWSFSKNTSGEAVLTFADDQTYYGYDVGAVDITKGSTALSIEINTSSTATGVKTRPEYDYSRLGDTWSSQE